jgi:saccharopine dehydrogenase (NAD+, L-lysine-forming)
MTAREMVCHLFSLDKPPNQKIKWRFLMSTVLIIGSGGVASVGAQKCAQNNEVFKTIIVASRTKSKCEAIVQRLKKYPVISIAEQVDAEVKENVVALIKKYKPVLVMNLALPYQNIPIMEACIETKTHYLDTAAAEVREKAGFEYSTQWVYHDRFKKAGVMALLGSGFDPGVTSVFCMYGKKHYFDTIDYIVILLLLTLIPKSTLEKLPCLVVITNKDNGKKYQP